MNTFLLSYFIIDTVSDSAASHVITDGTKVAPKRTKFSGTASSEPLSVFRCSHLDCEFF